MPRPVSRGVWRPQSEERYRKRKREKEREREKAVEISPEGQCDAALHERERERA